MNDRERAVAKRVKKRLQELEIQIKDLKALIDREFLKNTKEEEK